MHKAKIKGLMIPNLPRAKPLHLDKTLVRSIQRSLKLKCSHNYHGNLASINQRHSYCPIHSFRTMAQMDRFLRPLSSEIFLSASASFGRAPFAAATVLLRSSFSTTSLYRKRVFTQACRRPRLDAPFTETLSS
jgi:hypothetical protein